VLNEIIEGQRTLAQQIMAGQARVIRDPRAVGEVVATLDNAVAAPGQRFATQPEFFVLMMQTQPRGMNGLEGDQFFANCDSLASAFPPPSLMRPEHGAISITSQSVVGTAAEGRLERFSIG